MVQPPGEVPVDAQRRLDDPLAAMATAMAMGLLATPVMGEDGSLTAQAPGASPEEASEVEQLRGIVRGAIAELPEREAELIRRHYLEGDRFDHVAAELGLSKSWASRLHTRAIERLTKRLAQLV